MARNKELTQKLQAASKSEEEEEGAEEEDELLVPDAVNEVRMNADGPNPWMLRNGPSEAEEVDIQKDPEQPPEPVAHEASESEGEENPVAEEEMLLKELEERRSLRKKPGLNQDAKPVGRRETKGELRWPEGRTAWG